VITSTRVVELSTNNKHTLLFRMVQPLDFGYFKCRATNMLGVSEQIIQLSGKWFFYPSFQKWHKYYHAAECISLGKTKRLEMWILMFPKVCVL
jgi:hypothetical protein